MLPIFIDTRLSHGLCNLQAFTKVEGRFNRITLPNPILLNARAEFDAAPVGSGGLGQKLPPIFLIGWGLI